MIRIGIRLFFLHRLVLTYHACEFGYDVENNFILKFRCRFELNPLVVTQSTSSDKPRARLDMIQASM